MDIQERLAEFFRRLAAAPPAANAEQALALVCRLIEQIEDELCPVPRQYPAPRRFTGRMYPPKEDRIQRFADGRIIAETRHHLIHCRADGSISIIHVPTETRVLYKKGRNERAGGDAGSDQ